MDDFFTWQKSVFVDMVYLQQDAFDAVDAAMPARRQMESSATVKQIAGSDFAFGDREQARDFFTRMTGHYKNLNHSPEDSPDCAKYSEEIEQLADQFRLGQASD